MMVPITLMSQTISQAKVLLKQFVKEWVTFVQMILKVLLR